MLEDPILHDSTLSQLVQAADLVAYAAYQHLWANGTWPQGGRRGFPVPALAESYHRLAAHWMAGSTAGVHWA